MTKAQRERAERLIAEPGVLGASRETCEARKAVRATMRKVLAEVGRMVREGGLAESDAPAMLWQIEREARARIRQDVANTEAAYLAGDIK